MRLSVALHALVLALVAVVYAPALHAAPVDVSAVASGVADQLLALSLVGGAFLLLAGAISGLRYLRQVMGASSGASASASFVTAAYAPSVRGYSSAQEYLDSLASRLAAQDEFLGVDGPVEFKENDFAPPLSAEESAAHDAFEASYRDMWASQSQRADAEASGADMALYDQHISEGATHDEARRWSKSGANAEIHAPVLGPGWK